MPNQHLDKNDPMRGKKSGKWTKYGGAIYGLEKEEIKHSWFCQICAEEIPKELSPFNYELLPGEFIRICNTCKSTIDKIPNQDIRISRTIMIRRTKRD